jgi:hypothetical protein
MLLARQQRLFHIQQRTARRFAATCARYGLADARRAGLSRLFVALRRKILGWYGYCGTVHVADRFFSDFY